MNEELLARIEALEEELNLLKSSATIPFEVDGAFRDRFNIDELAEFETSTKTVADETQAVNEGGAGTYNVPKVMDGLVQTTFNGVTIHIPYYNT